MKKKSSKPVFGISRKTIKKIHLYLGIPFGLLVFIISITGALYVFKDEIQDWTRKNEIYACKECKDKKPLALNVLIKSVREQVPENYPLAFVKIPMDKRKSYEFYFSQRDRSAWNYYDEFKMIKTAYVDPHTGKILKIYDEKQDFFFLVLRIHFALLFGSAIGNWVVGGVTFIFLLTLVTGIILWYPKNKKILKQRFWFRWKNIKNWKRKNYDLHNILGFYSSFVALITAITGLFYAFKVVPIIIYFIFSGGKTRDPFLMPELKSSGNSTETLSKEILLTKISQKIEETYPSAASYRLMLQERGRRNSDRGSEIMKVPVRQNDNSRYVSHELFFDKKNADLLLNVPYGKRNFGEKIISANYDIHVGSILGIWGKILVFIVSLICASLPVTGFLIWYGRNKKRKKYL